MKKNILIVDDEENVLHGLERMLRPLRHEYEMHFVTSGAQALSHMSGTPVDVLVADMRMPGMNGAQLLTEVMQKYPAVVRIILSGHSDAELIARSVGVTHQFLSKPCDPENFKKTVQRAVDLRALLQNSAIKALVSQMGSLPTLPSNYYEIAKEVQSPDGSIHKVAQIVARDPGMTAKILQLVNSAFFGIRRRVTNPSEAAAYLGLECIQHLCLSAHVFSQFEEVESPLFSLDGLWRHSLATATLAKKIAVAEDCTKRLAEDAFTAGLLHDIGKVLLFSRLKEEYSGVLSEVHKSGVQLCQVERDLLQTTHAEVGAYLLGLWGLPDDVIEAIAYHHRPGDLRGELLSPLTVVHVANVLLYEEMQETDSGQPPNIDETYLSGLGLSGHEPVWREICKSMPGGGEA